ncbi:MAG: CRISPR-associated ring nuclease Csm6 [Defluviicoccus sp.]
MRNILVISVGETPQVVTETLWNLLHRSGKENFVADDVHIVTTTRGRDRVRGTLINDWATSGKLVEFCDAFSLRKPTQDTVKIHVATGDAGEGVEDPRDPAGNIAYANKVATVIRDATRDADSRVHASLAGGRKTMSFYMGYAMSMFGRPQDSLSHVLVPPEFEGCEDFWWIPKEPIQVFNRRDNAWYSTADARIDLAEIPFLRLHQFVGQTILRDQNIDFARVVRGVQAALEGPTIRLDDKNRHIFIADEPPFQLPNLEYALYRVLAEAGRQRWPGAGPDGLGPDHSGWVTMDDLTAAGTATTHFLEYYASTWWDGFENEKVNFLVSLFRDYGDPAHERRTKIRREIQRTITDCISGLRRNLALNIPDNLILDWCRVQDRWFGRKRAFGLRLHVHQIHLIEH